MKAAIALCFVALLAAHPAVAQQARGQLTASAIVVEAIGVAAGATAVTQSETGMLDVTTPLAIRGSVPRVVQVLDGTAPRPISAQLLPACADANPPAAEEREACSVRSSLRAADAAREGTVLTYQVATVN